jgi:hydrogenase maturation protease
MLRVIGLGNILRGDDGIGPQAVQILQDRYRSEFSEISDAGSDPFSILEKLVENKPVLVIDCARMGLAPGSIKRFVPGEAEFDTAADGLSLHGFNLAEVWQMAKAMGTDADLIIVGVQPDKVEFNTGLSRAVQDRLPTIVKMVREEAKKYA